MGRKSTTIPMDTNAFRIILKYNKCTMARVADITGVTRQAVNGWLARGVVPPSAMSKLIKQLNLQAYEVAIVIAVETSRSREIEALLIENARMAEKLAKIGVIADENLSTT